MSKEARRAKILKKAEELSEYADKNYPVNIVPDEEKLKNEIEGAENL